MVSNLHFGIQDGVIPRAPRLLVYGDGKYICDSGMLHDDSPQKLAEHMIAIAKSLHTFTSEELINIKPHNNFNNFIAG